jgi:hypothetical protein
LVNSEDSIYTIYTATWPLGSTQVILTPARVTGLATKLVGHLQSYENTLRKLLFFLSNLELVNIGCVERINVFENQMKNMNLSKSFAQSLHPYSRLEGSHFCLDQLQFPRRPLFMAGRPSFWLFLQHWGV